MGPTNKALMGVINISEAALPIPGNIPPRAAQEGGKKGQDGILFCRRAGGDRPRLFVADQL